MALWSSIITKIITSYHEIPNEDNTPIGRLISPETIDQYIPWAYFDGTAQAQGCAGGILLHKTENHRYKIQMGLVLGTNKFAELISLKHLLHFALAHACYYLQIFGDSKIIINWFNNISTCHVHTHRNILDDIMILKAQFNYVSCQHIYKECNMVADQLSKEVAAHPRGLWLIQE